MTGPQAAPIALPLSGGQADATVALRPLLCAEITGPPGWFHRASGRSAPLKALGIGVSPSEQIRVPIVAFVIEHPGAGTILIDTGFHASALTHPRQNLGMVGSLLARGLRMDPSQTAVNQCRALGIEPSDIELIVMTHLHFDHASALADFPQATILVSKREWKAANAPLSALAGYSRAQLDPRPSYRTVDFGTEDDGSSDPYGQTLDLFGDGSVLLLWTPGHSSGHMSVIARLSDREALIAGDAIYTIETLRGDQRPWRSQDEARFERSLRALQAFDRDHPGALIIPGHDMDTWKTLASHYQ
jgi:N-acyl homoserine lactone hydrolase